MYLSLSPQLSNVHHQINVSWSCGGGAGWAWIEGLVVHFPDHSGCMARHYQNITEPVMAAKCRQQMCLVRRLSKLYIHSLYSVFTAHYRLTDYQFGQSTDSIFNIYLITWLKLYYYLITHLRLHRILHGRNICTAATVNELSIIKWIDKYVNLSLISLNLLLRKKSKCSAFTLLTVNIFWFIYSSVMVNWISLGL